MNQPFAPIESEAPAIANVEAEAALIGVLLAEPKITDAIADGLAPDDFHDGLLADMYGAIVREHSLGRPLNPVTLRPFFDQDERFQSVGGFGWLAHLTGGANIVGARGFAQQIKDLAGRRRMVEGLLATVAKAIDLDEPLETLAGEAEEAIASAMNERDIGNHERSAGDAVMAVIETFDAPLAGVTCEVIPTLDRMLGPIRPTHFDVGAGRPGMGKTAVAVSYARGAAKKGHGVLFFSLEMGAEELAERLLADECFDDHRIPYEAIRDRKLDMIQRREVCRAQQRIAELPIQIIDKAGLTIGQIRSMVRRWRRRFAARGQSLDLVIVDYLQLVRGERRMERIEVVSEVSRALKEIAKDNHLGVFALSQLSRAVETRADKRPQLSDLRESGQIEQDADAVLFFLRPEYYLRKEGEPVFGDPGFDDWQSKLEKCQGRIEFIVAKRRGGREGSAWGEFLGAYQAVRG